MLLPLLPAGLTACGDGTSAMGNPDNAPACHEVFHDGRAVSSILEDRERGGCVDRRGDYVDIDLSRWTCHDKHSVFYNDHGYGRDDGPWIPTTNFVGEMVMEDLCHNQE